MVWRTVVVALLCVQIVSAVQFTTLFGKIADQCAVGLYGEGIGFPQNAPTQTRAPPNCILANRPTTVPPSSATIILPSQNPTYNTNILATIFGRNFRTFGNGNPLVTFYLGQPTADPAQFCLEDAVAIAAAPQAQGQVNTDNVIVLNIPLSTWASQAIELESIARPICIVRPGDATVFPSITGGGVWTGFYSGAVFDCNFNDRQCGSRDVNVIPGLNTIQRAGIRTRTFCCRNSEVRVNIGTGAGITNLVFGGAAVTNLNLTIGQCINPNVQSCCGGTATVNQVEKCCNPFIETTQFIDGKCICRGNADCLAPATNSALGALAENTCCLPTRFNNVLAGVNGDVQAITGTCFNPANSRCCDTGDAYDPGSLQCCPINGLQTLDLPCPCNLDSDCAGISPFATNRCCRQGTPTLQQAATATCSRFTNYPLGGPIPPQAARCLGTCYDARFGICCNGATCLREVENCCNNTCCNRFTQGCFKARGQGSQSNLFSRNNLNFNEIYARCSAIEYLDSIRVFWFAVLPALLLAASFLGLALALVFVNKASARRTSFLEIALIVFSVITFLLALPLYFAPVYKYGIVTAFAAIVAILSAGVRVRWLNGFAIIFLAIAVIYVIDPFWGNAWLTLASDRVHFGGSNGNGGFGNPFIVGTSDVRTSGVLHATDYLFDDRDASVSPLLRRCVRFYDYFAVDRDLYDFARIDNPDIQTFGYCSRAWVIGLLYIEGLIILFLLVTFILAVLALIVRFRKLRFEPIELEVRGIEPGIVY